MNILDQLSTQHELLLGQLNYLQQLKNDRELYDIVGLKEIAFVIIKAIEKHAYIEEKILFPALDNFFPGEVSPIQVMQFEHKELDRVILLLKNAKEPYQIKIEIQKFIEFMKDHIAKEEEVVFPLARKLLDEKRLKELCGPLNLSEGYK